MSLFKKLFAKATGAVSAFTNGDCAEALVGGSFICAALDGSTDESEVEKAIAMFETNERLTGFDVNGLVGKWEKAVATSARMAKRDFFKLCESLASDAAQAEEVLIAIIEVADADGNIDDDEMAFLEVTASKLGLNLKEML